MAGKTEGMRWNRSTFLALSKICCLCTIGVSSFAMAEHPESVFFGDLHVHTKYSNDAFAFMTERSPDDAYRFAKGHPIEHFAGRMIQLETPLDFLAVTDHAEQLGLLESFLDPDHPNSDSEVVQMARSRDPQTRFKAFYEWRESRSLGDQAPDVFDAPEVVAAAWQDIVASADRHYEPGEFTTFAAYEWTASRDLANLHRNVIFEDTKELPLPLPADSNEPEVLWSYLERHRMRGVGSIAIPHNPNVSDGRMFALVDSYGEPLDANYAARRNWNEPLVEVTQNKGTSETHPALSPNDEFADFELMTELLVSGGKQGEVSGSYVREAYTNGVRLQSEEGFNPFMFGLVGASDFHSATSAVEEDNMSGMYGPTRGATPEQRRGLKSVQTTPFSARSAAGLTAVWAQENTREDIFAAFRRRETYATTGTRIAVRFFGGWDYADHLATESDRVSLSYNGGVPMGGILSNSEGRAPRFVVWAARDPNSGNLDRIQIIKGWSEDGENFERIYDVALADGRDPDDQGHVPAVGNTVDVSNATYTNDIGDPELATLWEDPDFDPDLPAFYYVRVLEIPTPRWTTYDAVAMGVKPPDGVPTSIQERAYTSPIWYLP